MEGIKIINVVNTIDKRGNDCYKITIKFTKSQFSHVKERLILYYLLQTNADDLKITDDDMIKIKTVINDDDMFFIEHLSKNTSVIEIIYNNAINHPLN
jgi:hypothetical protein